MWVDPRGHVARGSQISVAIAQGQHKRPIVEGPPIQPWWPALCWVFASERKRYPYNDGSCMTSFPHTQRRNTSAARCSVVSQSLVTRYDGQIGLAAGAFLLTYHPLYDAAAWRARVPSGGLPERVTTRTTIMDALTIRWNYVNSLVFVNLPHAAARVPLVGKEKALQASLPQQGVPSDVITQVIELVPYKGTITLHDSPCSTMPSEAPHRLPPPLEPCRVGRRCTPPCSSICASSRPSSARAAGSNRLEVSTRSSTAQTTARGGSSASDEPSAETSLGFSCPEEGRRSCGSDAHFIDRTL